ncbi:hypothetical protein PCC7424_2332 [Gloeothece citriformis PCC 7424]|uniref:Uncharacterized protein n=1 Tax=Gloeothece citriformis (strain PCC 7424) TaxID=65393 RepID=B7KHQ8_GLOC7|nr:hypothetical protein [Gloeothece citriformis]ACK70753.1 hypothetical protein PCC7424_2332 [Gloeothece citriformis PCC 7424]
MATQQKPGRPNDKKSDQWEKDLHSNTRPGNNIEATSEETGRFDTTAYDIKELHDKLENFKSNELRQIPVLKPGTRLQQGATYINLNDPARREFTAMGDMSADANNFFVPKAEVDYMLWNRLIGEEKPR